MKPILPIHHCKNKTAALLSLTSAGVLLLLPLTVSAQETGIIAPGAKVKLLADGFKFTEGPASNAHGDVYFTDQPNDRILKWSTDGKLTTFMQPCGRSNGLCFDDQGNLWACADEKNQLWCIDPKHGKTVVIRTTRASY